MAFGRWLGISNKGEDLSEDETATEDRIQEALDKLVTGSKQFGNRTMSAGEAEDALRAQGILPEGWRLRKSDSTSSGYRPTQAASKKKAALHAGILGGAAVTGAGLAGLGPLAGLAGLGSAAPAAGSVGLGETGAVTGLAGSGFGTGAGLGFSAIPGALGGGAAAAGGAAGAGMGLGETGATTGLGGSGFGLLPGGTGAASGGIPAGALTGSMPMTAGGAPGNAALLAAAKGGNMLGAISPEMWQIIASSGAGFLNNVGAGKNQKAADAAAMERLRLQVANDESARDPYRQQMSQMQDLGRLDAMEQMKPQQRAAPIGKYAGVVAPGQLDSYAPSADMLNWLASMKRDVSSGKNTAPTMTNPGNYGKTSVLPLQAPGTPLTAPPAGPYKPPTQPSLYDMAGLAQGGGGKDQWGRSPGDPNYGKPPSGGSMF